MWCNLVADGSSNHDRIARKMSPAQFASAKRLARQWLDEFGRKSP
jgi:hypothetical protein|tara:strand:- start:89 stop:223 length:135 start_codon:yes stop_codon:yes gene_type:complete